MNCKDKDDCCTLDVGRGCKFCGCKTEETRVDVCKGYYKLHTTDWLEKMPANKAGDIFEVRFKNTRRGYYKNDSNLPLKNGDIVAVEATPGHDIGIVSMTGDMVYRQMKRVGFNPFDGEYKQIYRMAKPADIEKWQESIALEHQTMILSRQIASELNLNMKIGDVEYQGDKIKAIFYYIADERVDFRELIKVLSGRFRVRIEMKQIGARQEAGRIGGLGSCGRELCCASWISSFVSITTNTARAQEISLNPQKLAGQCSKLKCCLIHEVDTYVDARRSFPRVNQPLQAMDGEYHLVKNDILAQTMSFSATPHAMVGVVTLSVERVKEILALNKQGKKVEHLEIVQVKSVEQEPTFVNMIEHDSITRFDGEPANQENRGKSGRSRSRKGGTRGAEVGANRAQRDGTKGAETNQTVDKREEKGDKEGVAKGENRGRRRATPAKGARPSNANATQSEQEGKRAASTRGSRGGQNREVSGEKKVARTGGRARAENTTGKSADSNRAKPQTRGKRGGNKSSAEGGEVKNDQNRGVKKDAM